MKTKREKTKVLKRAVTVTCRDGLMAFDLTAEVRSSGMLACRLLNESRKLAKLLHATAIEMGYSPLDIKITEAAKR